MSSPWKKFSSYKRDSFLNVSASSKCEKGLLSLKREKMKKEKSRKQFKLDTGVRKKGEKHGFKPMHEILKRKRLNARTYKKWLGLWATKREVSDLALGRTDHLSRGGHNIIETNGANEIDERVIDVSFPDQKGKEVSNRSTAVSLCKDMESQLDMESDSEQIACVLCMHGGELLCCYGQGCKKRFHLTCLDPPLSCMPPGFWYCIWCVKKKVECGVHSVSEGIDFILDARDVVSDHEGRQKQYLVKYKGLAHVHSLWIPEKQLLLETPLLVARYNKNQTIKWKSEWTMPQRLLQKRFLSFPEGRDGCIHEHDGNDGNCCYEWLVKWTGLSYDNATWELENAPFLRSPEALKLVKDYETRHEKAKRLTHLSKDNKQGKYSLSELSELPFGVSPGVQSAYLTYVNKLFEFWHGGQNAVVIDYQERVEKAILFILSVKEYTSRPFLVITPSTTVSVWEAEFLRCVSSANIVVYKGNVDVRASIRSLEFYNRSGCIMFHILLSSADVVVEDLEVLECIEWEAIIIDECQRPIMSVLVKQINMLAAKMKMLLVSGQIRDRRREYQNLLSFVDPGFDGIDEDSLDVDPNIDICGLKEKLAQFVAYECKSSSSKFVEYWVPVRLSNVQLEQYCASLLSNSMLLSSCLNNASANTLHDVLHLTRKCCDHPYLVDPSLQSFITEENSEVGYLEIGIKVSAKLELLDKFLSAIKKRGLRVLIMFQSLGVSGLISLGDILDDFVHQRFGKDSYARIGGGQIVPSKKQAAVNMFNDKESGKFVFLIENRACLPSIKLSSVDTVILFGSDWDPLDDLRALQKITIDSQFEQLKVFRLYSCCTVEEKLLMLTKQGLTLDSNIIRTRSTCHKLLTWGASYLFNKLDDFHDCDASGSRPNMSSEQSLLDNVLHELSALLPCSSNQNIDPTDCSIVLEVQQSEGVYPRDILLYGEVETQSIDNLSTMETEPTQCLKRPHVFWKNLLEDRRPRWKFLSEPPKRIRRNVQIFDQLPGKSKFVEDWKFDSTVNFTLRRSRTQNKRKLGAGDKKDKSIGSSRRPSGCESRVLPRSRYNMHNSNHFKQSLAVPPATSDISGGLATAVTLKRDTVRKVRRRKRAVAPISQEMDSVELTGSRTSTVQPHFLESHPLPTSSNPPSTDHGQVNMTAPIEILNHQNNANCATGQGIQVPRQPPIEDSTGLSSPFVQPSINVPVCGSEADASSLRSTTTIQESRNNHSPQVSPTIARTPRLDPLQMEMERIQKDEEKAFKMHKDTITWLKDERDKEIDAIHKRYDSLLQDADIALVQKRKDLETCYKQVFMHKLLAEALRQKHNNAAAAGSRGMQQATASGFMNEILQLYFPQNGARTIPRLEQSLACLPMAGTPETTPIDQVANHSVAFPDTSPRTTGGLEQSAPTTPIAVPPETTPIDQVANRSAAFPETSPRTTVGLEQSAPTPPIAVPPVIKPVQVVSHPSELISTNLLSPCSNPMIHGRGSLFSGSEIRAPAPHLRRFRPPPLFVSSLNLPNLPTGVPSLQSPGNPPLMYSMMPVQLTPDLHRYPSGSNNDIPQPENGLPVMDGCPSPELPTTIIDPPASDLNMSIPLSNWDSTYCAT